MNKLDTDNELECSTCKRTIAGDEPKVIRGEGTWARVFCSQCWKEGRARVEQLKSELRELGVEFEMP